MLSKYRLWCLLFMLIFVASCAGSASYMKASETLNERPPDDKALVRFMRPYKFSGSARNFFVLDQEKAIGNNPVSTQFDYLAAPGKHLFISGAAGARKSFLEADLEGGRIYYVIVSLNLTGVRLIPVKKNSEYWDKVKKYETKPEEAADFVAKTGIETFAAQIGNLPGVTKASW